MENNATAAEKTLDFLPLAERLKRELRHSWLSDGREKPSPKLSELKKFSRFRFFWAWY